MKRFLSVILTIAILSGAYVGTLVTFENETLAVSVTLSMGVFSAIMHASNMLGNSFAFEAIVIPDFTEKSQSDIDGMKAEEFEAYLVAKNAHATALMKSAIQEQIGEAMKNNADSQALKELKAKLDTLAKEHDKAVLTIKSLTEKGGKIDTEKTALETFIERDQKGSLENKAPSMNSIEIKAAALMTTANVVTNVAGGFNQLFGNYVDSNIYEAPKPENYILPLVTVSTAAGTENIWYVERENEEGNAQFIGEGDLKPLADGEWIEKKADIKEVAVRWKMSNRLIMHAPSVVQNFRMHANELVEQVIDDGVATGDGLGNNLDGIATLASPFIVPPSLANSYQAANIYDAIMAVATYVRLNNFKGQLTCVLNTVYMAQMAAIKDSQNNYIVPPFVTKDGKQVGETRILFTNKLAATKIMLGDLKKFNVVIAENVKYFEGWENDDFSKNLSSRKLEAFLGTYLPDNHAGAIIFDDIATVLAAIAAP